LNALLVEEFGKLLGPMQQRDKDEALQIKMDELKTLMMNDSWLYIRAGTKIVHEVHKARGGLIRADFEVREGRLGRVCLSGDFFYFPGKAVTRLESRLEGRPTEEAPTVLTQFYSEEGIEIPGIKVDDWMKVLDVRGR